MASVHESPICPHTSLEQAQKFVRVSCGYLHADVIAKHQQEASKGRNLLVCNPLKVGWLWTCGHLAPARVTCRHITGFLRTRKYLYTANLRVYFRRTWCRVYEDVAAFLLRIWGQPVVRFLPISKNFCQKKHERALLTWFPNPNGAT